MLAGEILVVEQEMNRSGTTFSDFFAHIVTLERLGHNLFFLHYLAHGLDLGSGVNANPGPNPNFSPDLSLELHMDV